MEWRTGDVFGGMFDIKGLAIGAGAMAGNMRIGISPEAVDEALSKAAASWFRVAANRLGV